MSSLQITRPWILGSLAVYAPQLYAARQAYEMLAGRSADASFGTVILPSGEEIDWVDMSSFARKATEQQ